MLAKNYIKRNKMKNELNPIMKCSLKISDEQTSKPYGFVLRGNFLTSPLIADCEYGSLEKLL